MSDLHRLTAKGDGLAWRDVVHRLTLIDKDDRAIAFAGLLQDTDRAQVRARAAQLYVRYTVNSNELTVCHDCIIQPQVRILIRKMLICIYGRILELKQILMDEDLSLYTPISRQLMNLRLAHEDFELRVPRCFRDERQSFLDEVDNAIDFKNRPPTPEVVEVVNDDTSSSETPVIEAVKELGPGADDESIWSLKLVKDAMAANRKRQKIIAGHDLNPTAEEAQEAAIKIQRRWRFYHQTKITEAKTKIIDILTGMHKPSGERPNRDVANQEWEDKIRHRQAKADVQLREVTINLQETIDKRNKSEIIEGMIDELRMYIMPYFKQFKVFPTWPFPKIIVETDTAKTKKKARSKPLVGVTEPSVFTVQLEETFNQYVDDWKIDNGSDEVPREDLIRSEILANIRVENQPMVDGIIQKELERLNISHARDLGQKRKKPKKKRKKRKKSRKRSKKTEPPIETYLEVLVKNNMIKKSVTSKFSEFQGEMSYCADAVPRDYYSLGDIRQIIKELFVIGLISPELRALKKTKFMKSLLIAGPNKSGKTMLTNAVCTETGSLKIELNFENVSENYPEAEDIKQLVDVIIKCAKAYQPVVIEVDLADIPFYKKLPNDLKPHKAALKKMVNLLKRLMKSLKVTDRVIIIGKAACPWLANAGKLKKIFQAIVFTVPDNRSVFTYLRNILLSYPQVSSEFPVGPLATLLADYPRQLIADMVAEIMSEERMMTLITKPLDPMEFIPVMMKNLVKDSRIRDRYHNWYTKSIPLGRKWKLKIQEDEKVVIKPKTRKPQKTK